MCPCLAPCAFANITYPGVTVLAVGWGPHISYLPRKCTHKCLKISLLEEFSQLRFFFPDDAILCQVNKRFTIIQHNLETLISFTVMGKLNIDYSSI